MMCQSYNWGQYDHEEPGYEDAPDDDSEVDYDADDAETEAVDRDLTERGL